VSALTKDPRDREEEFIAGLADDTGRDLAAWMALIDAQTFGHRNDMIDWLRQQGLTFAKASRLERIHHNGGRPLYSDKPQVKIAVAEAPQAAAVPVVAAPPKPTVPILPAVQVAPAGDITAFLAKAKGYRPLAELLIRSIRTTVPATALSIHDTHADLLAPALYGAVVVTAKDVRLALDLGEHPFEGDIRRLRLPGMAGSLTHTIVLSDARKIDAGLMTLVAKAAGRANS
jgi:hypothetical protein